MTSQNPYRTIHSRYHTEKATVLEQLKDRTSNPSLAKCSAPKYVFLVDPNASKPEIAAAIEAIYAEKKVRVRAVNVIRMKPKKRRVRGRSGYAAGFKKAIVTLEPGNLIDGNA